MLATLCWRNIILTAITTLCLLQIILVLLINFRREGEHAELILFHRVYIANELIMIFVYLKPWKELSRK